MVLIKATITLQKCIKHKFIHLLMATFKDLHIENSKSYKGWYCPHHTDCVSITVTYLPCWHSQVIHKKRYCW